MWFDMLFNFMGIYKSCFLHSNHNLKLLKYLDMKVRNGAKGPLLEIMVSVKMVSRPKTKFLSDFCSTKEH